LAPPRHSRLETPVCGPTSRQLSTASRLRLPAIFSLYICRSSLHLHITSRLLSANHITLSYGFHRISNPPGGGGTFCLKLPLPVGLPRPHRLDAERRRRTGPSFSLGVARQMAITNHYYFELTPEQRRNPQWHPDYGPTWDAFFINLSCGGAAGLSNASWPTVAPACATLSLSCYLVMAPEKMAPSWRGSRTSLCVVDDQPVGNPKRKV
jgi:hypothetical protein